MYTPFPCRVPFDLILSNHGAIIQIITNNRCKTIYQNEFDEKDITLDDCCNIAANELKADLNDSIIIVIIESPCEGEIFRYGNREEPYWEQIGTTCGYA